jgi:nitroreductase
MPEHDLYAIMQTTRAVRRLRPDPIPEDALRRILTAATWGPSGGNRQPWRVLVVRDAALKRRLGELYSSVWTPYAEAGRKAVANAPESIAMRTERALKAGDYLASHFHEVPVVLVFCFEPSGLAVTDAKLSRQSVVGGGSLYPAVQNALLACNAEGLGCVLTTLLCAKEPEIRPLLEIPEPWATHAFVPIGYPVGKGHGPISRRPVEEMAFADRWGRRWPS